MEGKRVKKKGSTEPKTEHQVSGALFKLSPKRGHSLSADQGVHDYQFEMQGGEVEHGRQRERTGLIF